MILIVSKCSIYHVKIPIFSSIFRGPKTPHTSTNFQEIFVNENACHILGTICEPFRIPTTYHINRFKTYVEILSSFELQAKKCTASHFFFILDLHRHTILAGFKNVLQEKTRPKELSVLNHRKRLFECKNS